MGVGRGILRHQTRNNNILELIITHTGYHTSVYVANKFPGGDHRVVHGWIQICASLRNHLIDTIQLPRINLQLLPSLARHLD